jgi:DNA-directed RNA polymerase subunit RPC12/RpoP
MYLKFAKIFCVMATEDSDIKCPFCKSSVVQGYVTFVGIHDVVYFSRERLPAINVFSKAWKEKEEILDGYPDNNVKTAYKCSSCNAILIEGTPNPTPAEVAEANQAKNDFEGMKDRARQMAGI